VRALGLSHVRKRFSLWEEFANKTIEIFVRTTLFGARGVREIDFAVEGSFDRLVVRKLTPVIERDGIDGEALERDGDYCSHVLSSEALYLPYDPKSCRTINKREECMTRIVFSTVD
jgi:hypothetical protein